MQKTTGLEYLLDYDGEEFTGEDKLTMRFSVKKCPITKERPLGIRYSLTLHDEHGKRILGFDNAHAAKPPKNKRISGRKTAYDHVHRSPSDKGTPFAISSAEQLLISFFAAVDEHRAKQRKQ